MNTSNKTIVFIHGAWVTPDCWDKFIPYFENLGYKCIAPSWPFKEDSVEEQNKNPKAGLATLGIKEIVEHYDKIIRELPEKPILIGHSFGGMFVQMLLDRGLGLAGAAIDPAPPKGIFSLYPTLAWALKVPLLTLMGWKKIVHWKLKDFKYGFVHTMPEKEQEATYKKYVVPESGRVFWQAALAPFNNSAYVNFNNSSRSPLLIIAGEKDQIVPAIIDRDNFKKYKNSKTRTDFKEFPGRVHWIIAEPGWEEVALYIDRWLKSI